MSKSSKPVPIALPVDLLAKIDIAARLLGFTKQAVMRLAMEIGLEDLRRCDYKLASAVVDAAKGRQSVSYSALSVAAEDPPEIRPEGGISPTSKPVKYRLKGK